MLFDHIGYQFGDVPRGLAIALFVAGLAVLLRPRLHAKSFVPRVPFPATVYLSGALFFVLLNGAMILRHPPLLWPDVHRYYYWIPVSTTLLFASTAIFADSTTRRARTLANLGLIVLLALNLAAVSQHWSIMQNGHLKEYMAQMPALKRCLADSGFDVTQGLTKQAHRHFCTFFRENRGTY